MTDPRSDAGSLMGNSRSEVAPWMTHVGVQPNRSHGHGFPLP